MPMLDKKDLVDLRKAMCVTGEAFINATNESARPEHATGDLHALDHLIQILTDTQQDINTIIQEAQLLRNFTGSITRKIEERIREREDKNS